jgi:hypothetical protein
MRPPRKSRMAAPVGVPDPSAHPAGPWRPRRAACLRHGRGGCGVQPRVQRGQTHALQGVQPPRHRLRRAPPRDRAPRAGSVAHSWGLRLTAWSQEQVPPSQARHRTQSLRCQLGSQAEHAAGRPCRLTTAARACSARLAPTQPGIPATGKRGAGAQRGRTCSVAVAPARLSCTPLRAAPSAAAAARSAPRPACSAPSACCPGSASWNARASAARSPAAYAAAS